MITVSENGPDWKESDGNTRLAGEVQVKRYGEFLNGYTTQLREIQHALHGYSKGAWDISLDPISLQVCPKLPLIIATHKGFCDLRQKTDFYGSFLLYGEGFDGTEAEAQVMMGHMIKPLQDLSGFINRCYQVLQNFLLQLVALYNLEKEASKVMDVSDVHFYTVFESIGELLVIFVTLDGILSSIPLFREHWNLYKQMVKSVQSDASTFGASEEQLSSFHDVLSNLDSALFRETILQGCFGAVSSPEFSCPNLAKEFQESIRFIVARMEASIGSGWEGDSGHQVVQVAALQTLHLVLFRNSGDKKLFRQVWDLYRKIPAVVLYGNVVWCLDDFLAKYMGGLVKDFDRRGAANFRTSFLQSKNASLSKDAHVYSLQPMTKMSVLALCHVIELIKTIEGTYHRHAVLLARSVHHLVQHLQHLALTMISSAKKRKSGEKKQFSSQQLDVISALQLNEDVVNRPLTPRAKLVLQLALEVAAQGRTFREEEMENLKSTLQPLSMISALNMHVKEVCDCSFLYWHRSVILPIYLTNVFENPGEVHLLHVVNWIMKMEKLSVQDPGKLKLDDVKRRCNTFLQGLLFAHTLSQTVKTMMNLHVMLGQPMTKMSVLALCHVIELIKTIEGTYHRHAVLLARSVHHLVQHLQHLALTMISSAKHPIKLFFLLESLPSLPGRTFREEEMENLKSTLQPLCMISALNMHVKEVCDCSFLYWHRSVILPIYLTNVFENPGEVHLLHSMFDALEDSALLLSLVRHQADPQFLLRTFEKQIVKSFMEHIVDPLCADIETDLRLETHSHLTIGDRNPFHIGMRDRSILLAIRPIRFFHHFLSIQGLYQASELSSNEGECSLNRELHPSGHVEHYLDKVFYNHTTVALHDWKTYGEMRSVAQRKYGLFTVEAHLPSQTLDQGLDILEIVRNIHVFVSKYVYNLNTQVFVERTSNNKHLNTISIRHLANSIRTHGTGIMNTTVNFTYQFLRKKFYIFSQFLFDDHIKSRLLKDLRYFRDSKEALNGKYPFDRAEKFHRGIRKLGLTPDGLSFLDQFRLLITHVGNAMGFVRLIRSGGLNSCSKAARFIPDLEGIISFQELLPDESSISAECKEARKQLDDVINDISRNFSEGTRYFQLLVDAFAPAFRDAKNAHLKNFHVIVPALTVNYVEYFVATKEKMAKKNKDGAVFTDDGFAMGIAYILRLLAQYEDFDSLHWFQAVQEKYEAERLEASKGKGTSVPKNVSPLGNSDDDKLQQTVQLTLKRLDQFQKEFQLLDFNLKSARIFFHGGASTNK
ncbi:unnamed protein product [Darwinula stevensoni]|uniref:WASH complex subunit 7 n=1 Tax=Darwinula stevensoni TaxID=69355 RepID=A0A7R9A457_9CRUS|nr:unnamed protein product [Darwinula stevensoni]CAG0882697.1 unnamed protein product [Darwinula stevensoni]